MLHQWVTGSDYLLMQHHIPEKQNGLQVLIIYWCSIISQKNRMGYRFWLSTDAASYPRKTESFTILLWKPLLKVGLPLPVHYFTHQGWGSVYPPAKDSKLPET